MNVVVNGLMTNYHKVGKGKQTLVFLHGWGDSAKTFSKLIEQLQDNYVILALDMPGFGGTQAPLSAWGIMDYVEFIDAWLRKIETSSVHAFIGHSYGGSVVISGVGNKILKPKKLVLLSSSGIRDVYRARRNVLKFSAKIIKTPLKILPANVQHRIKKKAYQAVGSEALLLPNMELSFKRLVGEDLQAVAAKISVPTLLIYGTKDKDTPVKYGNLFHKAIKGSHLEIIDAGHFLHQEQSEEVAKLVTNFLQVDK